MTTTATPPTTPPTTRPCACWARATGPARFYRLPPGEKRDVLAQAIARLYPTEGS